VPLSRRKTSTNAKSSYHSNIHRAAIRPPGGYAFVGYRTQHTNPFIRRVGWDKKIAHVLERGHAHLPHALSALPRTRKVLVAEKSAHQTTSLTRCENRPSGYPAGAIFTCRQCPAGQSKRLARQQKLLPRKEKEGAYAMEWGENERKKCAW